MPTYEFPRPIVTVDVAIFTIAEVANSNPDAPPAKALQVVLTPRRLPPDQGVAALPGTYVHVDADDDLDSTAIRVINEKCGYLSKPTTKRRDAEFYIEQLKTYSGKDRDPRGWSVTTAYFAVVPPHVLERASEPVELVPVDALGRLPFDHNVIIADALARIRGKASYSTLPAKMLPKIFSLVDLQDAYEIVLGRTMTINRSGAELAASKSRSAARKRPG